MGIITQFPARVSKEATDMGPILLVFRNREEDVSSVFVLAGFTDIE